MPSINTASIATPLTMQAPTAVRGQGTATVNTGALLRPLTPSAPTAVRGTGLAPPINAAAILSLLTISSPVGVASAPTKIYAASIEGRLTIRRGARIRVG